MKREFYQCFPYGKYVDGSKEYSIDYRQWINAIKKISFDEWYNATVSKGLDRIAKGVSKR